METGRPWSDCPASFGTWSLVGDNHVVVGSAEAKREPNPGMRCIAEAWIPVLDSSVYTLVSGTDPYVSSPWGPYGRVALDQPGFVIDLVDGGEAG